MQTFAVPNLAALPIIAIVSAMPICTFVFALLTYRAVKRIEARLARDA